MICLASASAMAQIGAGIRLGYTDDDPKQIHLGVHAVTMPFLSIVTFRPNFEFGFGYSTKLYAANFEVAAKYADWGSWTGYVGGGPALNVHKTNNVNALVKGGTRAGVSFIMGFEHSSGLFMEQKVGIQDSPTYKATLGYTFRKKQAED